MIVTAAFMAMDFRMQVEINVHTEGIMFQVSIHFVGICQWFIFISALVD